MYSELEDRERELRMAAEIGEALLADKTSLEEEVDSLTVQLQDETQVDTRRHPTVNLQSLTTTTTKLHTQNAAQQREALQHSERECTELRQLLSETEGRLAETEAALEDARRQSRAHKQLAQVCMCACVCLGLCGHAKTC